MDINKASAQELEDAFQVDGTRARYLVEHREKTGGFKTWDDVRAVPSFDDRMVEHLQSAGLTIGSSRAEAGEGAREERREPARQEPASRGQHGIDINSASAEQLEQVFQIDGERARYLIEARNRLGRFQSWDQIKSEVPSFDEGMVENLKRAGAQIGHEKHKTGGGGA